MNRIWQFARLANSRFVFSLAGLFAHTTPAQFARPPEGTRVVVCPCGARLKLPDNLSTSTLNGHLSSQHYSVFSKLKNAKDGGRNVDVLVAEFKAAMGANAKRRQSTLNQSGFHGAASDGISHKLSRVLACAEW